MPILLSSSGGSCMCLIGGGPCARGQTYTRLKIYSLHAVSRRDASDRQIVIEPCRRSDLITLTVGSPGPTAVFDPH